ncbi:MAG: MarR family winged helix-turn-helix transcriptional regulator [Solirubrobacteraceae bacterium]
MSPDELPSSRREDFVALLFSAARGTVEELQSRLGAAGYADVRGSHGCVFGNLRPGGMRLTELACTAAMTKQAVGEAVTDLERLGYAERIPDPSDGRAKIIRLTERGGEAQRVGFQIIAEIEREWAERFGQERVDALRAMLLDVLGAPPLAQLALAQLPPALAVA